MSFNSSEYMNERIPQAMWPEEWHAFFEKGFQPSRPGDEVFMKIDDADRYRLAALILTCHNQGFGPDRSRRAPYSLRHPQGASTPRNRVESRCPGARAEAVLNRAAHCRAAAADANGARVGSTARSTRFTRFTSAAEEMSPLHGASPDDDLDSEPWKG